MVSITMDGKTFDVPEGITVLNAARMAGIDIPTLCDHPEVSPYGGCRICLVEVEGMRTLQPSCTFPVSQNMVIHTNTKRVHEARNFVLTLIFSERNHFCPYCQVSGGDCELQNAAYAEGMTHWPLQPNWQAYPVDASHKYFVLEHNRCILCRRCVRACSELVGNHTLGFEERGYNSLLVADLGVPLGESSCISCGTCVQICPTGALIDRISAYRGRDTQGEHHKTVCVGCSIGCTLDVITRDNNVIRIDGIWGEGHNRGVLCKTGRWIPMFETRDRVKTPMMRKDGKLKACTWEDALNAVALKLKPMAGMKKDGIAAIVSTRLTTEALFLFKQLFNNHLQSEVVTSIEEGQGTAIPARIAEELGKPFEGKIAEIHDSDCVVVAFEDLVDYHEVIGFYVKRIVPNQAQLILLNTFDNKLSSIATLNLNGKKGSETFLLNGLLSALKQAEKSRDVSNGNADLATASSKSGIKSEDFLKAAMILKASKKPVIIFGANLLSSGDSQAQKSLLTLAQLTKSTLINIKGGANSMAAAQYELEKSIEPGGKQVFFVSLGDDEPSQRLLEKVKDAEFLVVAASYTSQLTARADVILPVSIWTEEEGHYLNMEGSLQKASASIKSDDDIWSNRQLLITLAEKLGHKISDKGWKEELLQRTPSVSITEI